MRNETTNRYYSIWLAVAAIAVVSVTSSCSDDPDAETPDFVYVSANPPSPELISIQGATLDEQDWPIAEPPRPDQGHIRPYISPDGSSIAFERRVPDGGYRVGRLFVVDIEGGAHEQLTDIGHDEACQLWPRGWDSEGETIAFVCVPVEDDQPRQVGTVDIDGETRLVASEDEDVDFTDVRWDGGDLVVVAHDTDGDSRSVRRLVDGGDSGEETIVEFDDDRFVDGLRISPDGDRAVVSRATETRAEALRPDSALVVVDLDGGETEELLNGDSGTTSSGAHVVEDWHPNGDRLLVSTGGFGESPGPLRFVDVDDDSSQTVLVEADELIDGTIRRAEIAPGGDAVLFSDNDADDDAPMSWRRGAIRMVGIDGDDLETFDGLSVDDAVNQPTFYPGFDGR